MKRKVALITGITGQDGSYLAEFLLNKGYIVHGIKRRSSSLNTQRIDHLYQPLQKKNKTFFLHYGELTDSSSLIRIINETKPTEIYNLAAQSHVSVSFSTPEYTADVNALGTLRILESIRVLNLGKKIKFYQASTSELFGNTKEKPQTEKTSFYPRSPYAVSKLFSYWITINYRESYNFFACNGILFNHESPYRGETFITRKITRSVAKILNGLEDCLYVGNLNAKRDWGHAKDYIEAQWLILQQKKPDDFIISTGIHHTVREFIEDTFKVANINIEWKYTGLKEIGVAQIYSKEKKSYSEKTLVRVDKRYFRPAEVDELLGDPTKAKKKLRWKPKYKYKDIISEMLKHDLKIVKQQINNNDQ